MKFILCRLNIDFIKINKQDVIHINNDDDNVINKYKEINDNEFKIQFFKIRCEGIISNFKELFKIV